MIRYTMTYEKTTPESSEDGEASDRGFHQRKASASVDPAVVAAVVSMVWAARTGRTARLHVSGDFAADGRVDHGYVHAIAEAAEAVRRKRGGDAPVAWTYTHLPDGPWVDLLQASGVAVRLSDRTGRMGAVVVADRNDARRRRAHGERLAVCPAQLGPTTCADCGLCWNRPDVTIAFIAHGAGARKVRATL